MEIPVYLLYFCQMTESMWKSVNPLHPLFLQHDVKTALFLLPHVLLYVLLDGTKEDVEEVSWRMYDQLLAVGSGKKEVQRNNFMFVKVSNVEKKKLMKAQLILMR